MRTNSFGLNVIDFIHEFHVHIIIFLQKEVY